MATEKNKNLVIILAAVAIVAVVVLAMTAGGDTSNQLVTEEVSTTETIDNGTAEVTVEEDTTVVPAEDTPVANTVDSIEDGLTEAGEAIDNTAADVANEVGSAPENASPTDATDSNSATPANPAATN